MIESVINKIKAKQESLGKNPQVTVAFLGDSVTQGCFELTDIGEDKFDTIFEPDCAYSNRLKTLINKFYPNVYLNIINAGISGDSAAGGAKRLERDVLRYFPDLVVVSFGLNDSTRGEARLQEYLDSLHDIFTRCKAAGCDVIFMSANGMNEYVSCNISGQVKRDVALKTSNVQNDGILKKYFGSACELAREEGAYVCDCYSRWETMSRSGADMTALLANLINHPVRDFHWFFAFSLFETIFF